MAESPRRFVWDERTLRYRDARTGIFVSEARLRQDLDDFAGRVGRRIGSGLEAVYAGELTLPDWQAQSASLVRSLHIAAAALAAGGYDRIAKGPVNRRLQATIRFHLSRLEAFAKDVFDNRLTLPQAQARATLYGASAYATHQNERRKQAGTNRARGERTQERRLLRPAEHCDKCVEYARRGWVPIGTLPDIGKDSPCQMNCRCVFEFRSV